MIQPSFNFISQIAHFLCGLSVILISAHFISLNSTIYYVLTSSILVFALKEFLYDTYFETEEVSGGQIGNMIDFSFYLIGLLSGLGIVIL